jgi:hypothetical protein
MCKHSWIFENHFRDVIRIVGQFLQDCKIVNPWIRHLKTLRDLILPHLSFSKPFWVSIDGTFIGRRWNWWVIQHASKRLSEAQFQVTSAVRKEISVSSEKREAKIVMCGRSFQAMVWKHPSKKRQNLNCNSWLLGKLGCPIYSSNPVAFLI